MKNTALKNTILKKIAPFMLATAAAVFVASSFAATPPYHVTEGYYGAVTIRASGSCGFKPVTYKNAWFGEVLDSTDASQGWGIITASGTLLVLEEDFAPLRHSNNDDIGVGKDISYTNMVGADLVSLITSYSGCSLWSIVPTANSRATLRWDAMRAMSRAQINAYFKGFEQQVCSGPTTNQQCYADGFSGSIIFKGDWSTPSG